MQQPVLKAQVNPVIRFREPEDQEAIDQIMVSTFGAVRTERSVWNFQAEKDVEELSFIAELDGRIVGGTAFLGNLNGWQIPAFIGTISRGASLAGLRCG